VLKNRLFYFLIFFPLFFILTGASDLGGGGCGKLTDPTAPSPTLTSIAVTPVDQTILINSTEQYTATGTYSDSSTADITHLVTWSSSNESFVTLNSAGLASASNSETTSPVTISASLDSIVGSTTLSVVDETPAVNNLSVSTGPTSGGTSVVLTGLNLTGATAVQFGSADASSFTVDSATQITAVSPSASAGNVNIRVTTPFGISATSSANQFTFIAPPTVSGISPNLGLTSGGTSVILTGTNFSTATSVNFGLSSASFIIDSNTQITATSPANSAGTVDITVTTPYGTSTTSSADEFTYGNSPTVTGVSPSFGPTFGGTSVTITGTDFSDATDVHFGASSASFIVDNNNQITATSPANSAGTINITVTTPYGTSTISSADEFTYL